VKKSLAQIRFRDLRDDVLRIPFLLNVPGLKPGVRTDNLGSTDLAPTILGALGLEFGWKAFDGRDHISTTPKPYPSVSWDGRCLPHDNSSGPKCKVAHDVVTDMAWVIAGVTMGK